MRSRSIAIASIAAFLAAFGGCGGSGDATSTSSGSASPKSSGAESTTAAIPAGTLSASQLRERCAKARSDKGRYYIAAKRLGASGLTNRPFDLRALAATKTFKGSVEGLRHGGADGKVEALVQALSRQEKVLTALAANNVAEAQKYGDQLNTPLERALKEISSVCPGA